MMNAKLIYDIVKHIPKGRVSTYGAIAQCVGMKSGARLVGWLMNKAHTDKSIPAHRVVNKSGILTGRFHFENPNTMQQLLESEGLVIENDTIIDFERAFWNPNTELTP